MTLCGSGRVFLSQQWPYVAQIEFSCHSNDLMWLRASFVVTTMTVHTKPSYPSGWEHVLLSHPLGSVRMRRTHHNRCTCYINYNKSTPWLQHGRRQLCKGRGLHPIKQAAVKHAETAFCWPSDTKQHVFICVSQTCMVNDIWNTQNSALQVQ